MNVWITRGLQTALFTGGLLAVGTGIASADESTIDVTVPVTVTDNALAVLGTAPDNTPAEIDLPDLSGTISADLAGITIAVPLTVGGNAADAAGLDVVQPAADPATGGAEGRLVDADVPVTLTGNAVAVLGNATATETAPAPSADAPAGLVDVDAPVLVCGNGIAVLGDATSGCTTPGSMTPGGNGGTDSSGGGAIDVVAPVTACGNGIGLLSDATATCTSPATPVGSTPLTAGQPAGQLSGGSSSHGTTAVVAPASSALPRGTNGSDAQRGTADADTQLAYTGSSAVRTLLVGLLALLLGSGALVLSRRRAGAVG